jgi:hypothetical protein
MVPASSLKVGEVNENPWIEPDPRTIHSDSILKRYKPCTEEEKLNDFDNADALSDLIEKKNPLSLEIMGKMDTCALVDSRNRTFFDVAIASDYRDAIDYLSTRDECINYFAPVEKDLHKGIGYALNSGIAVDTLEGTEAYIYKTYGTETSLQRSPLLQACRHDNHYAIEQLLSRGADTGAVDIAGYSAVDLCYSVGGERALKVLFLACEKAGSKAVISESIIRELAHDPELLDLLYTSGKRSVKTDRILLSLYCSLLDHAGVKKMLDDGLRVNSAISRDYHPLFEACSSYLLWEWKHPRHLELAYSYTLANGPVGHQAIHIDNDLIANIESLEDFERLFAEAENSKQKQRQEIDSVKLSADQLREQMKRRLAIIDLLLNAGLKPDTAEKKAPDLFISRLIELKQPELIQKLAAHGFSLKPADYEIDLLDNADKVYLEKWMSKATPDPLGEGGYDEDSAAHLGSSSDEQAQEPDADSVDKSRLAIGASDVFWELPAETSLLAKTYPDRPQANQAFTVRLTLHNSYGPCENCRLSIRLGEPDDPTPHDALNAHGDWQLMTLKEELLELEDGTFKMNEIAEKVFEEAPWSATFETALCLPKGSQSLEVRIESAFEAINCVISGWIIEIN